MDERTAVRRLHDRLGFGPRPGDLDIGFDATLDRLLAPAAPDGPAPPQLTPLDKNATQQRADDEKKLVLWWLDRMVATTTPVVERLTWFWHGHFATSEQKVRSPFLMLAQNQTFRQFALGPFAPLAKAMITDPAMLVWLDGNANRKGTPNENLAREFMELFALGIGHYSENDVREAARALTGWTVKRDGGTQAQFAANRHDSGEKQILGQKGTFDAASFADLVLARPESPKFVASRLWARLVSSTPPGDDVLGRLVAAQDVRSSLRAIATEPAFRDPATTLVKQPVEWLVGLMRALGVRPSTLDQQAQAKLLSGLRGMGQVPFQPPSVGGWAAGGAWLTTASGVSRLQLAQLVTSHAQLAGSDPGAVLGVDRWSDRSRAAWQSVASNPAQAAAIAACAPEYVVST